MDRQRIIDMDTWCRENCSWNAVGLYEVPLLLQGVGLRNRRNWQESESIAARTLSLPFTTIDMQALVKCSLGIAHNKMACPSVNPYGFVQEVTRVSHDKGPEILWLGGAATMKDFCRDLITYCILERYNELCL